MEGEGKEKDEDRGGKTGRVGQSIERYRKREIKETRGKGMRKWKRER